MKTAVLVIVALLAGMVLGSWSVKVDLRRATEEAATLKKDLSRRAASPDGRITGIASMLKLSNGATAPREKGDGTPAGGESQATNLTAAAASSNTAAMAHSERTALRKHLHEHNRPEAGTLRRQLETAASAWQVRSDLARSGFLSNVAQNDQQSIQFDVTMAAMNIRLSNSVRTWVEYVKQEQRVDSEAGIRIMNDLSAALVQAYNDLDRTMPADWRAKAGPEFEVVSFIDPQAIMPLTEVEGVFAKSHAAANPTNAVDADSP